MKEENDVMIDIETMGAISNSVIVSIGAVRFDMKSGKIGPSFYVNVDIDSCLKHGLKVTGSTIKWWLTNSKEAREEVAKNGVELNVALEEFSNFFLKDDCVWSNGVRFDIALLEDAYIACDLTVPWNFAHNAIDDCLLQIKYCSEIYNKLNI